MMVTRRQVTQGVLVSTPQTLWNTYCVQWQARGSRGRGLIRGDSVPWQLGKSEMEQMPQG